jgi:hypothetical protein
MRGRAFPAERPNVADGWRSRDSRRERRGATYQPIDRPPSITSSARARSCQPAETDPGETVRGVGKGKAEAGRREEAGPVGLNRLDGDTQMLAKPMADEIAKYRAIAARLSNELE